MNREKGLFRLAVVLAPVFGIVAIVLNNLLVLDLDNIGTNYNTRWMKNHFRYGNPTMAKWRFNG